MELKFLETILFTTFPTRKCYVIDAQENVVALKSSKKAGFRYVKDILENGTLSEVLVITREQVDRRVSDLLNQK